jgi:alcohol dehydrogenase class IV
MGGYSLDKVPAISQSAGALDGLGADVKKIGGDAARVLLVADPGLAATGVIARAEAALDAEKLPYATFSAFKSDPSCAQADEAAALARRERATIVVALGGGSALDVGKAVAAVAGAEAPAVTYQLCEAPLPKPLLKICIPTTSGTGSETTRTAVLSRPDGTKIWLWGDELKADLVLLDPTVTVGLPPALTAATGIDALVHAIEACTNANGNPGNDIYAHGAIRLVAKHLLRAVAEPGDLEARGGLQVAAAFAGIAIDNCGTAVAHNIGHALASIRPVHHGRAVGLAMLATLEWNAAHDPEGRFAAAAEAMGLGRDAKALAPGFASLLRRSGIKVSLAGEGHDHVTPELLAEHMAAPENAPMRHSNHRTIADADLIVFARAVLTQE